MMVTLLAPTLAMNANFPFGLKVTLWAPLSAGIVVISLRVIGLKTCTLADFILVTQSSAAQLSAVITPAINTPISINERAAPSSFTRRICAPLSRWLPVFSTEALYPFQSQLPLETTCDYFI